VKWKGLYGQYRTEMRNALQAGKEKNNEANEVIKKYKEVGILFLICFINPFLLK
jgi:RNA-dependent RNA polymerase